MKTLGSIVVASLLLASAVPAADEPAPPGPAQPAKPPRVFDPYFLGYEREPSTDFGARSLTSFHGGVCRFAGWVIPTRRWPFLAPLYEWPLSLFVETTAHEMGGHGARAREFDLDPTYGFASTSIRKDPESNFQLAVIGTAGTEAGSTMSHRILQDLYEGGGADGSKVPLLFQAKTDYSLYVALTPDPGGDPTEFQNEYESGNDIAFTITARQAHRVGADPLDVWDGDYAIDFTDPLIEDVYDELRAAALWNMLDPAFFAALASYVWDHCWKGQTRVRPPVVPFGSQRYGLTVGTRAYMGPEDVSRVLDLYVVTPGPLFRLTGRDLSSSLDRTYGVGAGVSGLPLGRTVKLSVSGDLWDMPESAEGFYSGTGWNVVGEVDVLFAKRFGFSAKLGGKSEGFFPATPLDAGVYGGAGLLLAF
jgi:hypothetical protein